MSNVASPFKCDGTAKRLPGGPTERLIIRIDDTDATAKVVIRIDPDSDVTAATAHIYLNAGEAFEFKKIDARFITIFDISDNPNIYWWSTH